LTGKIIKFKKENDHIILTELMNINKTTTEHEYSLNSSMKKIEKEKQKEIETVTTVTKRKLNSLMKEIL
jgi:type II secretory pathway predicted ATPase ExeA